MDGLSAAELYQHLLKTQRGETLINTNILKKTATFYSHMAIMDTLIYLHIIVCFCIFALLLLSSRIQCMISGILFNDPYSA